MFEGTTISFPTQEDPVVKFAADRRGGVAGVFESREAASRALAELVEGHFEPEDISMLLTDDVTLEHEDVRIREGALAVGAFGVVTGWVVGLGLLREEADFHAAHIKEGSVWVGVHAMGAHAAEAHSILEAAGAKFFPGAPGPGSDG